MIGPSGSNITSRNICDECLDAGHGHLVKESLPHTPTSDAGCLAKDPVLKQKEENIVTEPTVKQQTSKDISEEIKQSSVEDLEIAPVVTQKSTDNLKEEEVIKPLEAEVAITKESAQKNVVRKPLIKQRSELGDSEVKPGAKTNNQTSPHQTDKLDQTKPKSSSSDTNQQEICTVLVHEAPESTERKEREQQLRQRFKK